MRCLRRSLVLLVFVLSLPRGAAATTVDQVCTGDPCRLANTVTVDAGTGTLDFGSRELRITRSGRLRLQPASKLTIRAGAIVLQAGALIDHAAGAVNRGADLTLRATGDIQLQKLGPSRGRIDLAGDAFAGGIHLDAGGSIVMSGALRVESTAAGGDAGTIDLTAFLDVTVGGDLNLKGASGGSGGDLTATATSGRLIVTGDMNVSGGNNGGDIILQGGSLVSSTGTLDASGNGFPSDGGTVTITGGSDVRLAGKILTFARGGFAGDSGDAGDVAVTAGGTLIDGAAITSTGGGEDGSGADVDLTAGVLLRITAAIDVQARGSAGTVAATADEVGVEAEINADGDGGEVTITTARPLTVAGPVTVTEKIHASGSSGSITLEGCNVSVPSGGQLKTDGAPGGDNVLRASGQMTIAGTLSAKPDGHNQLLYRDPTRLPITSGADIQPAATQQELATLLPCAGPPVCGNRVREAGEGCDDGNTTPCDATHCSATCQVEVCGNGTPECGEQCDDGNAVNGDTCDSNCTTPRCGNGIVAGSEACDDGNTTDGDGCDSTCHIEVLPGCGDGTVQSPEQCDDQNDVPCDGCDDCVLEGCGNGFTECDEECDDFNTQDCDGCSSTCRVEHLCGNGGLDCDEQCDNGAQNGQPGSDCDSACRFCAPGSSPDCPCVSNTDCNSGGVCAGFACQAGECVSTAPMACADDGNVCNGVRTCDPAMGCVDGAKPVCNDGDPCTDDTICDPVLGCTYPLFPGFSGLTCRVGALDDTVSGAPAGDISRSVQKKLKKLVAKIRAGARKAQNARKARKATKLLAGARKQLGKVGTVVSTAVNKHKLQSGLAARLMLAAGNTTAALDSVSGSLTAAQ